MKGLIEYLISKFSGETMAIFLKKFISGMSSSLKFI